MNKFIQALQGTIESYSPVEIITIMLVALVGGLLIYATYRFTSDASIYNRAFNVGNVIIALITAVIMMMIASNIVISLGMVGALSIVRFRTAVKEARDTIFIFWSIVLGLCAGSQNFILAALSSLFICIVVFAFSVVGRAQGGSFTLIVRTTGQSSKNVERLLREGTRHFRLRAAHTTESGMELVYKIKVRGKGGLSLLHNLHLAEEVYQANLSEVDEI